MGITTRSYSSSNGDNGHGSFLHHYYSAEKEETPIEEIDTIEEERKDIEGEIEIRDIPLKAIYKDFADIIEGLDNKYKYTFGLIEDSINYVSLALSEIRDNNLVESDYNIQKFHLLLPQLYNYKFIGDSFASIILALFYSLNNLRGNPANLKQIKEIYTVLNILKNDLEMTFDKAADLIIRLEDTGLQVEPEEINTLSEFINE